jgi:16S rRNA (cytosine1402-N4)-methyltransferase
MSDFHTPVLLKEAINGLNVRPGGLYIDATIGGGGHAGEIIRHGGKVLGIDQDQEAIEHTRENNKERIKNNKLTLVRGNFADIARIARERGFDRCDGILFDLGVSSYQLERSKRGFSFLSDDPLDMRMSEGTDLTAYEIVNKASGDELYNIFSKFGEEKNSRAISDSIVRARSIKPIETSRELAEVIAGANGKHLRGVSRLHPATKAFQALRIVVNREIDNLKKGLEEAFEILAPKGRLAVISFHSLEDRAVKLFFAKLAREGKACLINRKPIVAGLEEISTNRRSRSAKLRITEKQNL